MIVTVFYLFVDNNFINAQLNGFKAITFQQENGLAQNTVHDILQDSKGFIWLGMRTGGLDRFDGYNFVHHRYSPYDLHGISGNEILRLAEDSYGFIWVGTRDKGLNRYNPRNKKFYKYSFVNNDSTTIPNNTILSLREDKLGQVWIGTAWGLCVYNRTSDNFLTLYKQPKDKNTYFKGISDIVIADDHHVLVSSPSEGVFLINCETKKIVKQWKHDPNNPSSLKSNDIVALLLDKDGQVWCGNKNKGISRLANIKSDVFVHFVADRQNKSTISNNVIRDIEQDSKGNIWITSPGGVNIIAKTETKLTNPNIGRYQQSNNNFYSLSQNAIYNVCEDRDGAFWIGTWSDGVNYVDVGQVNFSYYAHIKDNQRTINIPYVRAVEKYKNLFYVGTQGGGLNVLNTRSGKYTYYKPDNKKKNQSISSVVVSCFEPLDDRYLMLGTNDGINYFDTWKKKFLTNLSHISVRDLEMDNDSNIWVASQTGLYLLDTNQKGLDPRTYKDEDYQLKNKTARVLFKDSKNRMWVGTSNGLKLFNDTVKWQKNFLYEKEDETSISSDFINCITEDKYNNIWVGTVDGLNLFREDSVDFISFGEWDGLPTNEIHNVFSDEMGKIWISTIKGLTSFSYNPEAETKLESLTDFKTYTVDDGLQGNTFTYNSAYKSDEGIVYLGGENGYNAFVPEKLTTNTITPKVVLSDFKLFNRSVEIGVKKSPLDMDISYLDELTLNHKQVSFTIEYTALNYNAAEKCLYAYKMAGYEEEWNEVGKRREANYSNLPAGNYTFMVKASNNDGLWSGTPTTLKVTILPAWWNTWLFRITMFLLISGIVFYIVRRRTQASKERQRELEEKVTEATAESDRKNAELEQAQIKLNGIIEDVKAKLGNTSSRLLEATNSQASSIEEVSASIDQMAKEINDNADGAAKMFENAKVVEDNSAASVDIFSKTVTSIEDISKGIKFIAEFAKTTNLLSLNAAIEAAKAGEHGRSFGVVANEVKKLADNSQEVAIDIKKLSDSGLELSHEANEKIITLKDYIKDIVELIGQIRTSSQNQSYEATNVNSAIQQISNYVSDTANLAEQLDEAIKSLSLDDN